MSITATLLACALVRAVDGDTIIAKCPKQQAPLRVRVQGIDAPEIGRKSLRIEPQPGGAKARDAVLKLCTGRRMTLRTAGTDIYGRTLARVTCGTTDLASYLVRNGHAWAYLPPAESTLPALQYSAQQKRRGLWSLPDPVEPWEWRARRGQ